MTINGRVENIQPIWKNQFQSSHMENIGREKKTYLGFDLWTMDKIVKLPLFICCTHENPYKL